MKFAYRPTCALLNSFLFMQFSTFTLLQRQILCLIIFIREHSHAMS